jgi:hypothetical protein
MSLEMSDSFVVNALYDCLSPFKPTTQKMVANARTTWYPVALICIVLLFFRHKTVVDWLLNDGVIDTIPSHLFLESKS